MRNFPSSTFFADRQAAPQSTRPNRSATELGNDPFAVSPHTFAMLDARAMLAPLVMVWDYRVPDAQAFAGWLMSKDILLKEARLSDDPKLSGIKYGGTYRIVPPDNGESAQFRTHWGFTDHSAMEAMHALCGGIYDTATIAQIDLMEFVHGVKSHVAAAGDKHFAQQILVASSVAAE